MTPGIPGTGIGGLFYMLSTAALPLRELLRRARGRAVVRWPVIAAQQLMAAGILAGIWTTGWLLGVLVGSARAHVIAGSTSAIPAHNMWRVATFALSLITLILVVGAVELAGLWQRHRSHRAAPREEVLPARVLRRKRRIAAGGARGGRWLFLFLAVELVSAVDPPRAVTQAARAAALSLAQAESTYRSGDADAAVRAYAAVLTIDPGNSRATYRLADLQRHDPARALPLFRRYVALEPTDPWGYLAVADMLSRLGRFDEALHWSADAAHLAPAERDAIIGRARVLARARRTDAALAIYRLWLTAHPRDVEALQEEARELVRAGRPGEAVQELERSQAIAPDPKIAQRLAIARGTAAPAFVPTIAGSHDSDGNTVWRLGGALELGAAGPLRLGVSASHAHVADGVQGADLDLLALRSTWQPRATITLDATAGGTRIGSIGGSSASLVPTGQLRARWRAPASRVGVEFRADKSVVDASPLLVANRVIRNEAAGLLALPVAGPLSLRAIGKAATLSDSLETNHKTTLTGVLAVAVTPAAELSVQMHQIHYDHQSASGYFAPWMVQIAEAGTYVEIETPGALVLAVDGGAGVQRVAQQRAQFGKWTRALRLYAMLDAPVAPACALRLELESEDSQIAPIAATSGRWRYNAIVASLRWALP